MSTTLEHPQLGHVAGIKHGNVLRFLGIQYATLENRFAQAKLVVNNQKGGKFDKHGPTAVMMDNACQTEHMFIQKSLPYTPVKSSDTDCLNLDINMPTTDKTGLPVFVFIHGGGFALGSNAWPQYDLAAFVGRSVERGTPVIAVGINYRLGVFGFLASQELLDAGIDANRGLKDQLVALEWIHKNIAGFGGDPENVTVAGESAGAISALIHACRSDRLFRRVMSMGGTPLLMSPISQAFADNIYASVTKQLDLHDMGAQERINALLAIDKADVVSKVSPSTPFLPVLDRDIVPLDYSFEKLSTNFTNSTCDLLIGDCGFDSSILFYMLHDRLPTLVSDFVKSTERSLAKYPDVRSALLDGYRIGNEDTPENLQRVLEFGHDICFYAPVVEIAKTWPQSAYVFHFNENNPWDGQWKGFSTHILDVAFLFLNYQDHLSKEEQETALAFCDDVLDFVSGKEAVPRFGKGMEAAKVYGPGDAGSRFVQSTKSEDFGRRPLVYEMAKKTGLDVLLQAWKTFMAGM
ncbi:Para-nitrobenzyl esterase [Cyphellophora attinorum]|uniref:Carboxylic ester hydrolase n=1 Tax=Cyphellophora attinorum TaxID=1664694 RepID=A0A0N1HPI8_9EURO|nr:Para-nitrobenzyl esterase [Phialophora attinorum]KPI39656.1 Para-nitrobenzyl esterase [Phialophora attinorum]